MSYLVCLVEGILFNVTGKVKGYWRRNIREFMPLLVWCLVLLDCYVIDDICLGMVIWDILFVIFYLGFFFFFFGYFIWDILF